MPGEGFVAEVYVGEANEVIVRVFEEDDQRRALPDRRRGTARRAV